MAIVDADSETKDERTREHSVIDGRLIYRKILPLKDLAGITAAVTLYCSSFKKLTKWEELHAFKYRRENDMICNLALPLSIRNMLGKYVNNAIDEIIEWCNYHDSYSITYQTCAVLFNNHHCEIVWKSDGEIDYQKTALKMLSHPDLEEQEKFKIASLHCLEDHMSEMWPLRSPDKIESLIAGRQSHTLLAYWYHFFNGDLHKMPDRDYASESGFIRNWYHYNPYVVIYFWKRLPSDEQQRVAIDLIKSNKGPLFQKDLLLEMNASQQLSIFKEIGVGKIIVNFTLIQHYSEYAVLTWECIRNTINQEQYIDMLTDILLQAEELAEETPNCNLIDVIDIMWKTTPSGLKRYASDMHECAVIDLLTSFNHRFHFGTQFAMLVSILSNVELRCRQYIVHKISYAQSISDFLEIICEVVIKETGRVMLFDKFVKLCIPNSEEQAEFKKKWIKFEFMNHYGIQLMKNGEWDELGELFWIFESKIINLAEYKIHLLTTLVSDIDYRDDKDDWPYTPSHEWKRFCSGMDKESLIGVLTNFRRGGNHQAQFTVLVNMLPNFEVDFRRNIVDKMISLQNEDPNIFEKLIIWHRPLLLHKFTKLCFTSTQEQFEFEKKYISENVLKEYVTIGFTLNALSHRRGVVECYERQRMTGCG